MADLLNENLKSAVLDGDSEQVKSLLANGGDVNYCNNKDKRSLLHLAPDRETAKLLLNSGANINAVDRYGMTPLCCAVLSKNLDLVKLMLTFGAKVNIRTLGRATPLHFATSSVIAKVLISFGSDINARDRFGRTPMHVAVIDRKEFSLVKTFLNAGFDMKARLGRYGNSLLHLTDSLAVTRELLSRGCNVNIHNTQNDTPLHFALKHKKDLGVLREILRYGADVNALDWEGDHPLIIASTGRVPNTDAIKLVLEYGPDIFAKPSQSIHYSMMNYLQSIIIFSLPTAALWLKYALLRDLDYCQQRSSDEFAKKHSRFPYISIYISGLLDSNIFSTQVLPYLDQFSNEILKMRTYKVFKNLTLYEIISKKHVCPKPIFKSFRQLEEEVVNHFPVYQDIIMPFLKDHLDRGRLFNKLKELQIYFCNSFGTKIGLNVDCVLSIAEYLSEQTLYNLILAFE